MRVVLMILGTLGALAGAAGAFLPWYEKKAFIGMPEAVATGMESEAYYLGVVCLVMCILTVVLMFMKHRLAFTPAVLSTLLAAAAFILFGKKAEMGVKVTLAASLVAALMAFLARPKNNSAA